MAREDWQALEEERRRGRLREDYGQADYSDEYAYDGRRRAGYRAEDDLRPGTDDFGQVDYSTTYAYDAEHRQGYRRDPRGDRDYPRGETRSWMERAGDFLSPSHRPESSRPVRARRGPPDRVLWAVIMERLDDERRLDLRDVHVSVQNAEVTLNGTVAHKADKRRIEDVADVDGIRHVQNNLRVRDGGHWTFL